jgi:hypothetical protein
MPCTGWIGRRRCRRCRPRQPMRGRHAAGPEATRPPVLGPGAATRPARPASPGSGCRPSWPTAASRPMAPASRAPTRWAGTSTLATLQWETSQKELLGTLEYVFVDSHGLALKRSLAAQRLDRRQRQETTTVYDRDTRLQWLSTLPFTRLQRRITLGVGAAMDRSDRVDLEAGSSTRRHDERCWPRCWTGTPGAATGTPKAQPRPAGHAAVRELQALRRRRHTLRRQRAACRPARLPAAGPQRAGAALDRGARQRPHRDLPARRRHRRSAADRLRAQQPRAGAARLQG